MCYTNNHALCYRATNQTKDYFLKGLRQKGTEIEESGWESLSDMEMTQITPKQVTCHKC